MYGFESYVSIPIFRADGSFFGTLCAIDPQPAKLDDPALLRSLELYAQLVAAHLEAEERVADSGRELLAAHEVARLREQFIAVLGHDLGGPLHALRLGVDMLEDANLDPAAMRGHLGEHLLRMRRSAVRMQELIQDLLDFARGRLGSGIPVSLRDEAALLAQLEQVLSEVRTAHPGRTIVWRNQLQAPVQADDRRVGQVLANLLGNALSHGDRDREIEVLAHSDAAERAAARHGLSARCKRRRRPGPPSFGFECTASRGSERRGRGVGAGRGGGDADLVRVGARALGVDRVGVGGSRAIRSHHRVVAVDVDVAGRLVGPGEIHLRQTLELVTARAERERRRRDRLGGRTTDR